MTPTEIEGLVSRLEAVTCHKGETDSLTVAKLCHEAADALSQTIPRTDGNTITVSRMTLEWIAKKCADKRNPQVAFVVSKLLAGEALSALRGMADDAQTIPRTTDEGMRDKLGGPITDDTLKEWLEQAVREGDEKNGYVGPEWRYGDQEPLAAEAALAAMRRVSKTARNTRSYARQP